MDPLQQAAADRAVQPRPPLPLMAVDPAPGMQLMAVDNAPVHAPPRPPMLDLADAWAVPWDGPGSSMAVRAVSGTEEWRVKSTGDSGCSAMEVTMARLFRLTGLAVPETTLTDAIGCLPGDAWNIASRLEPTYQDLGAFLLSADAETLATGGDATRRQDYLRQRAAHSVAMSGCEGVLAAAGVDHAWQLRRPDEVDAHAAFDHQRFQSLEEMNRMLPPALQADQLRHYVASRWLGNWDHLNYRMENFGYVQRDGQPVGMTVDLGSCGPLGFRNLRNGAMMPKHASADVALLQRPASLFPIPDAYAANAAGFDAMETEVGALQDTLRWPYGFQSETVASMIRPPLAPQPEMADTMAEMGYRLALLPDAAITALVERHWSVPADARPGQWPTASEMAAQMCTRRENIIQRYHPAQLRDWIHDDPERAARVRQQVLDALAAEIGAGDEVQALQQQVIQAHIDRADWEGPRTSMATPYAINGLTREIRSLQLLHACSQRLQAALSGGDPAQIAAIAEELLSPSIFGQLLLNLEMGPGTQVRSRAPFEANHAWMTLINRLVESGQLSAQRVANCLLEPFEGSAYPPNIGAHAGRHPALGTAFVGLLETLMAASTDLTPTQLRERLLVAKTSGIPNFYSALAGSGASLQWDGVLQHGDLVPTTAEYIRLRSLWSLTVMKINHAVRRGNEPVVVPERQQAVAAMDLGGILDHLGSTYGPQFIAEMELSLLREKVYSTMKLTSGAEDKAIDDVVAQAVSEAWKKALTQHRLPSSIPVPTDLVRGQQEVALRDYRKTMRDLRRADAEALIVQGEACYLQAVLGDPQLSIGDRRAQLAQRADEISDNIRMMVRNCADMDGRQPARSDMDAAAQGHLEAAVGQAALQVVAAVRTSAQASAREQATEQARERATRSAQSHATQQARNAVPAALAAGIAIHAQAEAAKAAQQRATDKARQEAATRAARDTAVRSSAANAEIATRLAMLRAPDAPGASSSTSRVTDDQISARLRNLKAHDASPAAASRRGHDVRHQVAEYLDPKSGKPMTRAMER